MANSVQSDMIDPITIVRKAAPGTEILYDQSEGTAVSRLHLFQHARKGDSHILLVPQPSLVDPNDPLRWSPWKKWTTFSNALIYAFIGGVTGPIMAAWMVQGSIFFGRSLQEMTYANGMTLICQGVATTIWMPFAVKYGRRPVYLLSALFMVIACVWLGIASTKTFTPFIIGRAFLGIFEAPIESIVPSTITDIFFLHNRGQRISIYGLSVLGGNELGPMLSAFIIQSLGMNWAFYIVAMFIAANLVCMVFFMPETKYTGMRPSIDLSIPQPIHEMDDKQATYHVEVSEENMAIVEKKSFAQELLPWGRSDPDVNLWKAFLRPFVLLTYPTVIWSCIIYGLALSWNVVIGATIAQLFAPPPYAFTASQQGLVFLSPLIGSLVGTYLCGSVADRIANHYTKKNSGVREPEMRLPTCAIAAAVTFIGALISGLCFQHQTHWIGPVIGWGILSLGAQMGATLGMSYSIDCHSDLSIELMVSVASVKSIVAWIWTWFINTWLTRSGPLVVFVTIASVNVAAYLTTIIFYFYGKNFRIWIHEKDLLRRLNL